MQTFLPYQYDFEKNARALDQKRLIKQGLEAYQILRVNANLTKGWRNHPACLMWQGSEGYLYNYTISMLDEIERRGFKVTTRETISNLMDLYFPTWQDDEPPQWLLDDRVGVTHKAALYIKAPVLYPTWEQYVQYKARYVCCERCNYFWPTHLKDYA